MVPPRHQPRGCAESESGSKHDRKETRGNAGECERTGMDGIGKHEAGIWEHRDTGTERGTRTHGDMGTPKGDGARTRRSSSQYGCAARGEAGHLPV